MLMLYYVLLYENVRLSHMKSILGKDALKKYAISRNFCYIVQK